MVVVRVHGSDPELTAVVSAGLHAAGYTLHSLGALPWSVEITVEYTEGGHVELDSVDGPFERMLLKALEQHSRSGCVLVKRRGGVRQDRHCALGIPRAEVAQVVRALSWALHVTPKIRRQWWRRVLGLEES